MCRHVYGHVSAHVHRCVHRHTEDTRPASYCAVNTQQHNLYAHLCTGAAEKSGDGAAESAEPAEGALSKVSSFRPLTAVAVSVLGLGTDIPCAAETVVTADGSSRRTSGPSGYPPDGYQYVSVEMKDEASWQCGLMVVVALLCKATLL